MSEWLSIEKVPKDGTELILASIRKRQQWFDEWVMDGNDDRGGYWMMCDQWDVPVEPTHFRIPSPLPDAPKETCPRCAGSGFETDSTPCEFCGGDGWIFRRDAESRVSTPPETPAAAMRAAEEICAYFGDTELAMSGHVNANGVAAIITRHLPGTPARDFQKRLFDECVTANWDPERKNTFAEEIAHLHEELSEAFRAWRRYKDCEIREVNGKLEGVPIEFADALIGMFYNAELHGFDLLAAIETKHQFNLTRNYVQEGRQLHAATTTSPEATPNYALVQLLNAAMLHPEQAEGYIRRVIAELGDASPRHG